jgi:hypothetical protein
MRRLIVSITAIAMLGGCLASDTDQVKPKDERCSQVPKSGKCRAAMKRYYYDVQSGTCQTFIWGGCEGVVPFETMQECQKVCED